MRVRSHDAAFTVLCYHKVRDERLFMGQVDIISRSVPWCMLSERDGVAGNDMREGPHALISFDDGDRSVLELALPILKAAGIPGIAFVVAGVLDSDQPLWWQEVASLASRIEHRRSHAGRGGSQSLVCRLKRVSNNERLSLTEELRIKAGGPPVRCPQMRMPELRVLEASGVTVGNHTYTHPCLDQCDDRTVDEEITLAHEILTEALGHPPRFFAYPNGNYDPRVPPILRRLGYEAAFLFDHRIGPYPPPDRFAISRLRVNSTTSLTRFRMIVSGLHPALHHALGRP